MQNFHDELYKRLEFNNEKIKIHIEDVIRHKYYLTTLEILNHKYRGILFSNKVLSEGEIFLCQKESITFKTNERYPFLERFYKQSYQIEDCEILEPYQSFQSKFKNYTLNLLRRGQLSSNTIKVSMGLIFGNMNYLDEDFRIASKEGGIIHLFAASGLHLGIFLGFLKILFEKGFRFGYYSCRIIPLLLGLFYLILLNFPVSLQRAYLFAIFWLLASITFRKTTPLNLCIFCGTIISFIDQESFLGIGFNLSFGAVTGIFTFKKILDELIFGRFKNFFTESISLSLSAGIGTFPILIYFFKSYSYGAIFLNIVLVPLTSLILPILYTSLVIEWISLPILNELLWTLTELCIKLLYKITIDYSLIVGYYKSYSKVEPIILYFYIIFIFFIINIYLFYIYILKTKIESFENRMEIIELYTSNKERMRVLLKKLLLVFIKFSFHLIIPLIIFIFSYYGYFFKSEIIKIYDPISIFGYNFFLVKSKDKIFIDGDCKYHYSKIYKLINKDKESCRNIDEIHFSNLSCLSLSLKCNSNAKLFLYTPFFENKNKTIISESIYQEFKISQKNSKIQRKFEDPDLIFFAPHKENLYDLVLLTKQGKGKIVLQFPYNSKDSSEFWNNNRKLLSISESWEFTTYK